MFEEHLSRLFARPVEAHVWRIRRIDDPQTGQRIGPFLLFGRYPDGSDQNEWKLTEFEPEIVFDRWGTGTYSIELYAIDDKGAHASKGRSKYFTIDDDGALGFPDPPPPKPNGLRPDPTVQRPEFRPEQPTPTQTQNIPPAAPPPIAGTTAAMPQESRVPMPDVLLQAAQLMNFINAQADKRTDQAIRLEREHFAAEVSRQQAFYQSMIQLKQPQAMQPAEIAELVRQVVREELEDEDDQPSNAIVNTTSAPGVPTGDAAIIARSFENMLGKVMPLVQSALNGRINPAGAGAPSSGGD
jgi:hypothetical protein